MIAQISRRRFLRSLVAGSAIGLVLGTCHARAGSDDIAIVPDFRQAGDPDDTAAFSRAIATGKPVHVPAGRGSGPNGVYLVGDIEPRAGTVIFGDGMGRTILRQPDFTQLGHGFLGAKAVFFCDSGVGKRQISEVSFSDMTLLGYAQEHGFSEHNHLMQFSGIADLLIERVEFKGFQGDGLILASGRAPGERHNARVHVRGCVFDGINNNNRNAISVIDGDGILIENCHFRNCTHPDMPGAIDFEPDGDAYAVIRNTTIRNCRFSDVGGNVATIAYSIPGVVRLPPNGIQIIDNVFQNYRGSGFEISIDSGRRLSAHDPHMAIMISGNRGSNGCYVYNLVSAKGVATSGNHWQDYERGSHLGGSAPDQILIDTSIRDKFVRCGSIGQVGVSIFNVSGLALDGSEFVDCGDGGPNAYAISFGRGRSDRVSLQHITFSSPRSKTRHAIMKEPTHRFTSSTNRQRLNDYGGLNAETIRH